MCACVLSHFRSVQLFATLWRCSPPAFSIRGILQARILEWVAISFSRGSISSPRDRTCISYVPALAGGLFTTNATWEAPQINSTSTKKKKKGYKSQAFTSGMGGRRACRSQSLHPKGPCSCGLCASGALPWGHYVPGEPR